MHLHALNSRTPSEEFFRILAYVHTMTMTMHASNRLHCGLWAFVCVSDVLDALDACCMIQFPITLSKLPIYLVLCFDLLSVIACSVIQMIGPWNLDFDASSRGHSDGFGTIYFSSLTHIVLRISQHQVLVRMLSLL